MNEERKTESAMFTDLEIGAIPSVHRKQKLRDGEVPEPVIKRLPRYFRYLRELINENDRLRISSAELAEGLHISPSQVRQDLSCIGQTGQQGYGYGVIQLYNKISETLGVKQRYTAVLVGLFGCGRALAETTLLEQRGVRLKAVFDPEAKGDRIGQYEVLDTASLCEYLSAEGADIVIFSLKEEALKDAASDAAGKVRGVWNISQTELFSDQMGCPVRNISICDSLMLLTQAMGGREK